MPLIYELRDPQRIFGDRLREFPYCLVSIGPAFEPSIFRDPLVSDQEKLLLLAMDVPEAVAGGGIPTHESIRESLGWDEDKYFVFLERLLKRVRWQLPTPEFWQRWIDEELVRESQRQVTGKQRRQVLAALLAVHDRACFYCKRQGDRAKGPDGKTWHIEHAIPIIQGGRTETENLVLSCATCNLEKRGRNPDEFRAAKARHEVSA